jgi:hypothetical protein
LLVAGVLATLLGAAAPAADAAFGVSKWEAGTCALASCTDSGPTSQFYTQADGHPEFGITDFLFNFREVGLIPKAKEPEDHVKDVRVDLPVGLAVDPEVTEKCSEALLNELNCPSGSQVGYDEATGTASILGLKTTVVEQFPVYNMVRKPGQPARFAVELKSVTLALVGLQGHLYLEGGISWHSEPSTAEDSGVASGDFHEFFKIENIPTQPEIVESKLLFWGVPQQHQEHPTSPAAAFLTLPSTCSSKPVTWLHVDSHEAPGHWLAYSNQTPVAATGCSGLPLSSSIAVAPGFTQSDKPDAATIALHVAQATFSPSGVNSADPQTVSVTLPEGLTLNPSAAHGLGTCTNAQVGLGTNSAVACPASSKIGTVAVNAPGIPNGSLDGSLFLGAPIAGQGPQSGKEFRVFLVAEAPQYGVGLRLEGQVRPSLQTGRLTVTFSNLPQVPFEDFSVHLNGGSRAPLANPLACGAAVPAASLTPYSGQAPQSAAASGFNVDSNGSGGKCAASLPFALGQTVPAPKPAKAGAFAPYDLKLSRADGNQYLSTLTTTLPAGVLGAIPGVPLCPAGPANAGSCPASSDIGNVTVTAGSGSEPYSFNGNAYLTGPYEGAPYGLSIVVPAIAGPYNLGKVVTRARLSVGLYSGRVIVSANLPTVFEGVQLRLRNLDVNVNRPNFIFNPTSCAKLATESTAGAVFGALANLADAFQVSECDKLPFSPKLTAASGAKTSKKDGASLTVKITQAAHQGNIHEVVLQLPKVLPTRLETLQKSCPAASFEAGPPPGTCAATSLVGSASVKTPVLADPLTGPIYFVSHANAAFPDLDLILHGDGVEVVLVGHTNIASATGIITSTFNTLPDVPVSSVTVSLPTGPLSVLAANVPLCGTNLMLPTTIVSQTGAKLTHKTPLDVTGCPFSMLSARRTGRASIAVLVKTPGAGLVRISGKNVRPKAKRVAHGGRFTVTLHLAPAGERAERRHGGHIERRLHLTFTPSGSHTATSSYSSVTFRATAATPKRKGSAKHRSSSKSPKKHG